MENKNSSRRLHPLVVGAAVSVILVSLTGVAAITGLLPSSHGTDGPMQVASSVGAASAAASPAALVESKSGDGIATAPSKAASDAQHHNYAPRTASHPTYASSAAICSSCGRIESVRAIQQQAKPSGLGVVAGAVLGGVLGNQVGGGNGRALATVAGAVGGGYAGNEVEKRTRASVSYQVRVRMEDGRLKTFPYAEQPGWNTGDRVRVVNGQLTSRA